jgi:hypothetical protein
MRRAQFPGELHRLRRRGRTAVTWAFAAVCVAQVTLGALAHTTLRGLYDPMYFDKQSRLLARFAAAGDAQTTVVAFGSSRTANGFRGRDLERLIADHTGRAAVAYNLGIPAAGPVTTLVNLRRLLATGLRPCLVLIEVLPAQLADSDGRPLEAPFLHCERLSAGEVETVCDYGFPAADTRSRWRMANAVPWCRYAQPVADGQCRPVVRVAPACPWPPASVLVVVGRAV